MISLLNINKLSRGNTSRAFFYSGLLLFSFSSHCFGLAIAFGCINWIALISALMLFFAALGFSINLETSLRNEISDLATRRFKLSARSDDALALEAIHYTGALEKFVWSASDLVKSAAIACLGLIISLFSSVAAAIVAAVCFIVVGSVLVYTLEAVTEVRNNIATISKRFVKSIDLYSQNTSTGEQVRFGPELTRLGTARAQMLFYRTFYQTVALAVSAALGASGIWLHYAGKPVGIAILLASLFALGQVTKITDALTVALGEYIHVKELERKEGDL